MNYKYFPASEQLIVFLHGWGADMSSFLWLRQYFEQYSLLFLDFSGFGQSPPPERAYSLGDYVQELHSLLRQFKFTKLVLVGHSFGGRVAIKFAAEFADEFDLRLVLVDSAGMKPRRSLRVRLKIRLFKFLSKRSKKSALADRLSKKLASADYLGAQGVMRRTFVLVVNEHLEDFAKKISANTLIVWGSDDRDTKLFMAKRLHRLISGSELKVIDGAGHFCFLDKPFDFAFILDTFIKSK